MKQAVVRSILVRVLTLIPFGVFLLVVSVLKKDCNEKQQEEIYPRVLQGRILVKKHSHKAKAPMTELSSGTYFYSCGCAGEYLKNAKVGDSIYKPSNSYIFQIFKADTMLEIDVSCPPVE